LPAELRRIKRRLDWLEALVSIVDSQLRTQGIRIELHMTECEPAVHADKETRIRDAMGPHDARLYQVTRLLHEVVARQDEQAAQLADLARLIGPSQESPTDRRTT
jgi:hypothetical protein